MLSKTLESGHLVGVSSNYSGDSVLLQLTSRDERVRIRLTPNEAKDLAQRLLSVASELDYDEKN